MADFDCIVIGSGFGGAVTACRLAEAGRNVLVLERGRAYPPGSFPRSPRGLRDNLWEPRGGRHGMFDLWSFDGIDALVCSGLGGGSLIYANVLLRKDPKWFAPDEEWPVTRAELDPHYERVEDAMNAQRYPLSDAPYDRTAKTLAFKAAAERAGLEWQLPPLAVTFANDGRPPVPGEPILEPEPNLHNAARTTCRLCGECDIGCNFGAKNTLDYTYLSRAWRAGATLRTECEARDLERLNDGTWAVGYISRAPGNRDRSKTVVSAPDVVLSAGTFGTTYFLLRNRAALPGLSPRVGHGFSGNGDLLTFALRCRDEENNVRVLDAGHGPVITSAARAPDALDGAPGNARGFYIEDAGWPEFVSWMVQLADTSGLAKRAVRVIKAEIKRRLPGASHEIADELVALIGDSPLAAGSMPLLAMGRDTPDGRMRLEGNGRLNLEWSKDNGSHAYFEAVRAASRAVAEALGGEFADNPLWLFKKVITVHPLGGARMGNSAATGVVDSFGNVFNLPGLHVADGSVMPGSVGANPSLTIAALADRFADSMLGVSKTGAQIS